MIAINLTWGSVAILLFYALVFVLAWYVIKSAVRQGIIEAYTRLGLKGDAASALAAELRSSLAVSAESSNERRA